MIVLSSALVALGIYLACDDWFKVRSLKRELALVKEENRNLRLQLGLPPHRREA